MPNTHFQFKQFRIEQARSGMKVTTDGCLFGAWVADQVKENSVHSVLDIGAGTGILTLMLAQKIAAHFEAVECNELAFEEATQNAAQSPWLDRITVHQGTIQAFQQEARFDLIICNPPFFHQNKKGTQTHRNTAIHNDTLSIADLAESIDRLLSVNGTAFVMYPVHEMRAFTAEAQKRGLQPCSTLLVRDNPKGAALRMMCGFSKEVKPVLEDQLIIKTASGEYSRAFVRLLKDYYLYLD